MLMRLLLLQIQLATFFSSILLAYFESPKWNLEKRSFFKPIVTQLIMSRSYYLIAARHYLCPIHYLRTYLLYYLKRVRYFDERGLSAIDLVTYLEQRQYSASIRYFDLSMRCL